MSKIFVKICGITNRDDAFLAVGLGCDALGFNFVANSKRKVEIEFVKNAPEFLAKEAETYRGCLNIVTSLSLTYKAVYIRTF